MVKRFRPTPGDEGVTISELMVAVLLTAIVGAAVTQTYLSSSAGVLSNRARGHSTAEVATAMQRMTFSLQQTARFSDVAGVLVPPGVPIRTGDPLTSTTATSSGVEATFIANVGPGGAVRLVHWYVDSDSNLIEEVSSPDAAGSYAAATPQRRLLAESVVMPAAGERPLFAWYAPGSSVSLTATDPYQPLPRALTVGASAVTVSLTVIQGSTRRSRTSAQNFLLLAPAISELEKAPVWTAPPVPAGAEPGGSCLTCGGLPPVRALSAAPDREDG